MTKTSMCTGSALLKGIGLIQKRVFAYKKFAEAFSYPQDDELRLEYDQLFRANEVWLYGAEYIAENEFQRARILSDIAGFYKAFGLETDKDRPDMLVSELEFIYYLLYKEVNAPDKEKAFICQDAQRKFFNEHLYPAAKKISEKIISQVKSGFYLETCRDLLEFLESEKKVFAK